MIQYILRVIDSLCLDKNVAKMAAETAPAPERGFIAGFRAGIAGGAL